MKEASNIEGFFFSLKINFQEWETEKQVNSLIMKKYQ